jgi:quercetin dioxygenase-like cupin family protein
MANEFLRRPRSTGEFIAIVGDCYEVKASGAETDGKYALFDAVVSSGGGPPPHIHHNEDEAFFILEGEVTFSTQGKEVVGVSGTFVHLPKGIAHSFQNRTDRPARMLIQVTPAGIENYFRKAGVVVTDTNNLPDTTTPEAIQKVIALASEYGIEFPPHA